MTFIKTKKVCQIDDIDVIQILVSKEEECGTKYSFKYFIGYNDNDIDVIRPFKAWYKASTNDRLCQKI